MASRYKDLYKSEIISKMMEKFQYANINEVPKLKKIVVNIGVGQSARNAKLLDGATQELALITAQKPKICKAKKSVSNFALRKGMPIGTASTLRGERMFDFLDRLINISIPRIRDFRGMNPNAFDGRGNYTLGIEEQIIFPEINYDSIDQVRGMNITIVTTAKTDEEAFELLTAFGFPFKNK
ncbi:MAG TPA: 50S ribosomal protein L5 [candidate division Zixibacteria bacterium]|nr:50S ribosomal protein L5 [candidate division Zixibacteria bacterium]